MSENHEQIPLKDYVLWYLKEFGRWPSQRAIQSYRGGSFSTISKELEEIGRAIGRKALVGASEIPASAVKPVLALLQTIRAEESAKLVEPLDAARRREAALTTKVADLEQQLAASANSTRALADDSRRAAEAWGEERAKHEALVQGLERGIAELQAQLARVIETNTVLRQETHDNASQIEGMRDQVADLLTREARSALERRKAEEELDANVREHQLAEEAFREQIEALEARIQDRIEALEALERRMLAEQELGREAKREIERLESELIVCRDGLTTAKGIYETEAQRRRSAEERAINLAGQCEALQRETASLRAQFSKDIAALRVSSPAQGGRPGGRIKSVGKKG